MIHSILSKINNADDRIKCCAFASTDGLLLAYSAQQKLDEDCLGAMTAALFAVGSQGMANLLGGKLRHLIVEGDMGQVLITVPSDGVLLVVVTQAEINIQPILQQIYAMRLDIQVLKMA